MGRRTREVRAQARNGTHDFAFIAKVFRIKAFLTLLEAPSFCLPASRRNAEFFHLRSGIEEDPIR